MFSGTRRPSGKTSGLVVQIYAEKKATAIAKKLAIATAKAEKRATAIAKKLAIATAKEVRNNEYYLNQIMGFGRLNL